MKFIYILKYFFFNLKKFNNKKGKSNVLIELFNIKATIISFSLFANALSEIHNANLFAYKPFFSSKKSLIKHFFLKIFSLLNYYGAYKSFGCSYFLFPKKNKKFKKKADKIHKKILLKINNKNDIFKIKIDNIHVGDLIYDTYLREYNEITINILSEKFKLFLLDAIYLFLFWKSYLRSNNIKAIVVSHCVYLTALPARIAIDLGIKAYCVSYHSAYCLTKKSPYVWTDINYKSDFRNFNVKERKLKIKLAQRELHKRFSGKTDNLLKISAKLKTHSFSFNKKKHKVLDQNNKFKILIASHDFTDAPHANGKIIFADMYEWLIFLFNYFSNKKDLYDCYVKLHPSDYDNNIHTLTKIMGNNNFFTILSSDVSHDQLINEGIKCVLTVYGSIGHEYPYFNIPVVNAGDNPHKSYDFNYHPKNKNEYKLILDNIKKLKVKKDAKRKIYEFYYMQHMSNYNIFPHIGSVDEANSFKIYKFFLNNYSKLEFQNIISKYKKFIKSNKIRLVN